MKHLSEEQLVEHYYREPGDAEIAAHLAACAQCSAAFSALRSDLAAMLPADPPARDAAYGEQIWRAVAPSLPAYSARRMPWLHSWRFKGLAYAAACAVLLAGAFYAGRVWESKKQPATAQKAPAPAKPDVVLVVLGDHLDRSERLLVELKHVDADSEDLAPPLRDEARTLLVSNRACRQSAVQLNDPALAAALTHLDGVLTSLANQPDSQDAAALSHLQDQADLENLLFEVRVLRSRLPEHPSPGVARSSGGAI